jgi:hypothetical protein
MLIYTTARKSNWPHILMQWLIPAGILFLLILLVELLATDLIKITDTFYWIVAGVLMWQFIDLLSTKRVYKIAIDETARSITQYYRSPFSGEGEKIHTLDKVQLYVKSKASAAEGEITTQHIELYKSWRLILELDTKKHGFTPSTLQEIRKTLEHLLVPVTG